MEPKNHWENVYQTKRTNEVSWFQREPTVSLGFVRRIASDPTTPIIDVGGGASTLVDNLIRNGYSDVTVLDLSITALTEAQRRLGDRAASVTWLEGDILQTTLPDAHFGFWHDRAVFHFLTGPAQRAAYVAQVRRAMHPGGYVLVATFAEDGPQKCSGLPVSRYSPESLHREFDGGFELLESVREEHVTPAGALQAFTYCLCRYQTSSSSLAA